MSTEFSEISEKNMPYFLCKICDYKCCKKQHIKQHINGKKHKMMIFNNVENSVNTPEKVQCFCGKIFKERTGLWKHKKICELEATNHNIKSMDDSSEVLNLITELIKSNKGLQDSILEIVKNGITSNSNNNNNSNNKTFNLNFFLNETCKDAMNIMDFVDSIKLQLSDLENVGKLGYVEGISNIITSNLKALDVTQRPIHCADKKREILYVKDEDKWEKEDDNKKKIKKAIKRVVCKNQRLIPKFKEAHPDCLKSISKFSDQYNKIFVESMGGSGDNDLEKEDKIIRNISKFITIDKES
jgi:hypothetical protein